jgi:hypothetical protein
MKHYVDDTTELEMYLKEKAQRIAGGTFKSIQSNERAKAIYDIYLRFLAIKQEHIEYCGRFVFSWKTGDNLIVIRNQKLFYEIGNNFFLRKNQLAFICIEIESALPTQRVGKA